jgi:hypothetical protein
MTFSESKSEKNPKFAFYNVPYIMTLPRKSTKTEQEAISATATVDSEHDKIVNIFSEKLEKDKKVMRLWVERLGDEVKLEVCGDSEDGGIGCARGISCGGALVKWHTTVTATRAGWCSHSVAPPYARDQNPSELILRALIPIPTGGWEEAPPPAPLHLGPNADTYAQPPFANRIADLN